MWLQEKGPGSQCSSLYIQWIPLCPTHEQIPYKDRMRISLSTNHLSEANTANFEGRWLLDHSLQIYTLNFWFRAVFKLGSESNNYTCSHLDYEVVLTKLFSWCCYGRCTKEVCCHATFELPQHILGEPRLAANRKTHPYTRQMPVRKQSSFSDTMPCLFW